MTDNSLGLIGLSHKQAPVAIREQLSLQEPAAMQLLQCAQSVLCGFATLATCNRVEFYGHAMNQANACQVLWRLLGEVVDMDRIGPHLYDMSGEKAARHLARVASGLDSMVLGEPQILGQVAASLQTAEAHALASPLLGATFQAAIRAGKRARQETALGRKPVSVASVAVDFMRRWAGPLSSQHVVILGLGEMGGLVAKLLQRYTPKQLIFVNRNPEKAEVWATQVCARAVPLAELREAIAQADIVVSTTDAPHLVIEPVHILPRGERPLLLIDLAVPRDIDPQVTREPGIRLMDVDDLQSSIEDSIAQRHAEVPKVEAIIEQELVQLGSRVRMLAVEPVIAGLRRKAETIRKEELARALNELAPLSPEAQHRIEHFSQQLVKKLLHDPTRQLRHKAMQNGSTAKASSMIQELFVLSESDA